MSCAPRLLNLSHYTGPRVTPSLVYNVEGNEYTAVFMGPSDTDRYRIPHNLPPFSPLPLKTQHIESVLLQGPPAHPPILTSDP